MNIELRNVVIVSIGRIVNISTSLRHGRHLPGRKDYVWLSLAIFYIEIILRQDQRITMPSHKKQS
ncbi:MAG: hypothetical protein JXB49_34260 [Bacteroidales bacterium]|nr:hypothetical protein [Bacteroidales bacterium]